jgi:hypothetical protein
MLSLAALVMLMFATQDPKPQPPPRVSDEDPVPGLPDGEPAPLPEGVNWYLGETVVARTSMRERISLHGLWRFAPVPERETPVTRGDMGWIEMPGHWQGDEARVLDARLRMSDGLWRGRALDKFPWAWAERDLTITNAGTLKWLNRRVFLVIRGPWARAEVFVQAEPITGVARDGSHWFDITESLTYPGTVQLSMRLGSNAAKSGDAIGKAPAESAIALELAPTGPRVESIQFHKAPEGDAIVTTLNLVRPASALATLRGSPFQKVPLTVTIRLEDIETNAELQKFEHPLGTMPNPTRTVTVSVPSAKIKPTQHVRLHVRLAAATGITLDEPLPVEFIAEELQGAHSQ